MSAKKTPPQSPRKRPSRRHVGRSENGTEVEKQSSNDSSRKLTVVVILFLLAVFILIVVLLLAAWLLRTKEANSENKTDPPPINKSKDEGEGENDKSQSEANGENETRSQGEDASKPDADQEKSEEDVNSQAGGSNGNSESGNDKKSIGEDSRRANGEKGGSNEGNGERQGPGGKQASPNAGGGRNEGGKDVNRTGPKGRANNSGSGPIEGQVGGKPAYRAGSAFGIEIKGKRALFLVECTDAMAGQPFTLILNGIQKSLDSLGNQQEFLLVAFAEDCYPMFYPDFVDSLVPCTSSNKQRAMSWLRKRIKDTSGKPNHEEALEFAFELTPDTLFLITRGDIPGELTSKIHDSIPSGLKINIVAVASSAKTDSLRSLAKQNVLG